METILATNPSTIKSYFLKVRELRNSGEEYPVNLDDVWELVYNRRDNAVKKLKSDFIENEDFILASPKIGASWGGGNKIEYYLSVSAMEFFIAKKVKEVFNVYREVFHKTMDEKQKQLSPAEFLVQQAQMLLEQERRLSNVEEKVLEIDARTSTKPDYFSVMGFAVLNDVTVGLNQAAILGRKATVLCNKNNFPMESIPDPRFGRVKIYPKLVLEQVFNDIVI